MVQYLHASTLLSSMRVVVLFALSGTLHSTCLHAATHTTYRHPTAQVTSFHAASL